VGADGASQGLILAGFCLMVVNRVSGLVMPFMAKPLLDRVLYPTATRRCAKMIALVLVAMLAQAITSFALTQTALKGRPAADCGAAQQSATACWAAVGLLLR